MSELNIHQRIAAVMQAVEYVKKENKKVNNQYTFVSHDAVVAAIRSSLVANGLTFLPIKMSHEKDGNRTEVDITFRLTNIDKPEEFVDVPSFGYGIDNQDKGPGKARSYAKKYALLEMFLLETGDDSERDNIDHKKTTRTKTAVHKDFKATVYQMSQTTTIEAFKEFLGSAQFKALAKELGNEWPDEFASLTSEKDKHKQRLLDGPKLTSNDIENHIEQFIKNLGTEIEPSLCEEMFKNVKKDLLQAAATGEQIKEVEVAYDEHIQRLGD